MKNALLPAFSLAVCLIAAGCTDSDWNRMLNYGGMGADEATASMDGVQPPVPQAAPPAEAQAAAAAEAATATALPPNADFCKSIATQDATRNGFDQATQQRVFQRSFTQCVAIYTR